MTPPPAALICPQCGKEFALTAEYLAQYGGLTTQCDCGGPLVLPPASDPLAPLPPAEVGPSAVPVLSYAGPVRPAKTQPGVWQDGPFVVLARGAKMPRRCAVCNAPAEDPMRLYALNWTPGKPLLVGSSVADWRSDF